MEESVFLTWRFLKLKARILWCQFDFNLYIQLVTNSLKNICQNYSKKSDMWDMQHRLNRLELVAVWANELPLWNGWFFCTGGYFALSREKERLISWFSSSLRKLNVFPSLTRAFLLVFTIKSVLNLIVTDVERKGDRFHLIHITVPASAVLIHLFFNTTCNFDKHKCWPSARSGFPLSVQLVFTHWGSSFHEGGGSKKKSPTTTMTTTWMCWPTNSFSHLVHSVECTACSLRFLIYLLISTWLCCERSCHWESFGNQTARIPCPSVIAIFGKGNHRWTLPHKKVSESSWHLSCSFKWNNQVSTMS